jgi:feruloyl esterase
MGGNGVSSVQGLFSTPYDPAFDEDNLNMARDAPRFAEVGALNRTDGVLYSSFKQRGGKLLIYTGLSDFAFSPKDLVAYYRRLAEANGGLDATRDFARLFLVPGMTHCRGGQALDDFDPLAAVVDWVEQGHAPAQLLATGRSFPGRTRPLCAYPAETYYKGAGSADDAANFECRVPGAQ